MELWCFRMQCCEDLYLIVCNKMLLSSLSHVCSAVLGNYFGRKDVRFIKRASDVEQAPVFIVPCKNCSFRHGSVARSDPADTW